jgi:hypothetical protein
MHFDLADSIDEIRELIRVVARGEHGPGRVAHERVDVQLVGRAQQRCLERFPARRIGAERDPRKLCVAET